MQQVSPIEIFVKGLLIGVLASAPMGPVGILCVHRTLQKGRPYGIMTGAGAALSDIIYALFTGFGMSFAMDFIENERNMLYMQICGSVLLMGFGVYMFRSKVERAYHSVSKNKGTMLHNFITAFAITFSNPLIILLFVALFARFAFLVPTHWFQQTLGYVGIVVGAMLWWVVLTYAINKMKEKVSDANINKFNKVLGIIVVIAAVVGAVITLTKLDLFV